MTGILSVYTNIKRQPTRTLLEKPLAVLITMMTILPALSASNHGELWEKASTSQKQPTDPTFTTQNFIPILVQRRLTACRSMVVIKMILLRCKSSTERRCQWGITAAWSWDGKSWSSIRISKRNKRLGAQAVAFSPSFHNFPPYLMTLL